MNDDLALEDLLDAEVFAARLEAACPRCGRETVVWRIGPWAGVDCPRCRVVVSRVWLGPATGASTRLPSPSSSVRCGKDH